MDSELQWFSDQRFALCLREELLVTCMFRCFFLYVFFYSETWSPFERSYRFDAFLYDAMK